MANNQCTKGQSVLTIAITLLTAVSFAGFSYSQSQQLTVTTDNSNYSAGDTIVITGTIQPGQESTPILLQIINPENRILSTHVPAPDSEGKYSVEQASDGWEISGTYTVHVTHADEDQEATFEFSGLDSRAPAENLLVTFSDGTSRSVDARMTNGVITGVTAIEESATLIFSLATGAEGGQFSVTLAREMIDSREQDDTGVEVENNFLVLVDGDYADYEESSSTATQRTLVIPIAAGTEEIMIGGSSMVPEFPLPAIGTAAATALMIVLLRARIFKLVNK